MKKYPRFSSIFRDPLRQFSNKFEQKKKKKVKKNLSMKIFDFSCLNIQRVRPWKYVVQERN